MSSKARPITPLGIVASLLDDPTPSNIERARRIAQGTDPYTEAMTSAQSPACEALERATASEDWQQRHESSETSLKLEREMLSGNLEGQFLKMLVHATGARRVLEIGLFTGYSALAMAEALPAGGRLVALEIDAFAADFARAQFDRSPAGARIDIRVGPALDTLRQMAGEGASFDLVFIDADKPGYADYFDALVDGEMLSPRALVCVDNTLLQGEPYAVDEPGANGRAIDAFNRKLAADDRFEQVLLPIRDGVTLARLAG